MGEGRERGGGSESEREISREDGERETGREVEEGWKICGRKPGKECLWEDGGGRTRGR